MAFGGAQAGQQIDLPHAHGNGHWRRVGGVSSRCVCAGIINVRTLEVGRASDLSVCPAVKRFGEDLGIDKLIRKCA